MLIFTVDSDFSALATLTEAISCAAPNAQIIQCQSVEETLNAIKVDRLIPHVVFSEIQFQKHDGLYLASEILRIVPGAKIVFITNDTSHALDAFRIHVSGYMIKPVTAEDIQEELDALAKPPIGTVKNQIWAKCFGTFEVFWQGRPIHFQRHKSKELLAYLINKNGAFCTSDQIICDLWEECDPEKAKHNLRNLVADVKNSLRAIGQEGVFIKRKNHLAIVPSMIDCDYYLLLDGDSRIRSFPGEYMQQYSWAEPTAGYLHFNFGGSISRNYTGSDHPEHRLTGKNYQQIDFLRGES